jgi:protein involved in polysaccharide export with SLBB domain
VTATVLQAVAGGWTAKQIHDTVAAIARQPAYAAPVRQTLLGRLVRFIGDELRDLIQLFGGSQNARVVVIVAVALLILAIAGRIVVGRRLELRRRTASSLQIVGSTRRDYWALAAELEQRGDFVGASHALYLAVLDALSRAGGVSFHASKTVGDYVRDLRQRRSPFSDAFREFADRFERDVFGADTPNASTYRRLTDLAAFARTARAA